MFLFINNFEQREIAVKEKTKLVIIFKGHTLKKRIKPSRVIEFVPGIRNPEY